MARRRAPGGRRQYPRTARLNELLREIVAEELSAIDDEDLEHVSVTGVSIEGDLRRAAVFFDSLAGEDGDEAVLAALAHHRPRLQAAVNREAHMRRTPELVFAPDPAIRGGARVDEILRDLGAAEDGTDGPDDV